MSFGDVKDNLPYSNDTVNEFLNKRKFDEAKSYVMKYFAKIETPVGVVKYDAVTRGFLWYKYEELKSQIPDGVFYYETEYDSKGKPKVSKHKLRDWFVADEFTQFRFTMNVQKPLSFVEEGVNYINEFRGFRWQTPREPTKWEKEGIEFYWKHIDQVCCSSKVILFKYMKLWICGTISGRKMRTIMCLIGAHGAGKSTVPESIMKVLGKALAHMTAKPTCITTRFNGELLGKIFLYFEELKTKDKSEWAVAMNQLKSMATDSTIDLEKKGKDSINIANMLSILLCSNYTIQVENGDRKFVMTDISDCKVGDKEYFDKLYTYINNEGWQEAFFWHCKKIADQNTKWDELAEARHLDTSTKTDVTMDTLHEVYKYVKEEYVLKGKALDCYLDILTKAIGERLSSKRKEPLSFIRVSAMLKQIGIECHRSTGGKNRFKVSAKDLLQIYVNKKWIHELDEFVDDEEYQKLKKEKQESFAQHLDNGVNLADQSIPSARITATFDEIQLKHDEMQELYENSRVRYPKELRKIDKIIRKADKRAKKATDTATIEEVIQTEVNIEEEQTQQEEADYNDLKAYLESNGLKKKSVSVFKTQKQKRPVIDWQ